MEAMKVWVVGLDGAEDLILSLRHVWEAARTEELSVIEKVLSCAAAGDCSGSVCSLLAASPPEIIVLCVTCPMRQKAGEVLAVLHKNFAEIPVICVLESTWDHSWLSILDAGAADFVIPPVRTDELLLRMRRQRRRETTVESQVSQLKLKLGLKQFVGESPSLISAIRQIPRLAQCDASALITGETGTGKEMVARAIHYTGSRSSFPFVAVNCGAIPAELVENELFGHEQGAFTSANTAMRGLIHDADKGTLFLDEIDSLPLPAQVKLLRFLQDKTYRPLGARKPCRADVRIIAASNANLEEAVRTGRFRSDLFYRVNVLPLTMPSLRNRKEDIPRLARHFAEKVAREMNGAPKEISRLAMQKLICYHWPGNIRELENIIQRAAVLAEQPMIQSVDIMLPGPGEVTESASFKTLKAAMIFNFERDYLQQLLKACNGNITQAAKAAHKNRRAFWQLLRKHNLQLPRRFDSVELRLDKFPLRQDEIVLEKTQQRTA
jgi:DNA-binding NtrC family response regulator